MFGKILDYKVENQKIEICFEKCKGQITVLNALTIHVFSDCGSRKRTSKAITRENIEKTEIEVTKVQNYIQIETEQLLIKVFDEYKIDIFDRDGKAICCDYRGERAARHTASKESIELMAKEGHQIESESITHGIEVRKEMEGGEVFYGLGDRTGFFNKRGYAYELWNTDNPMPHVDSFKMLYKCIPFIIVLKEEQTYGIFMDNTYHSYWDFGKENKNYYYFAVDEGNLNYYFYAGNSIKEILCAYTSMTGTVPLPQLWTLGYHQSRFGYESRKDILEVAEKMRAYRIPCDAIHFDIDYMDDFKVFTFDENKFGNPKELMQRLAEKGIKPITIIDPGVKVEAGYKIYEDGIKNQYFVKTPEGEVYENVVWPGDAVYPDFGRKEVRKWWGDNQKYLLELGVRGVWNDMNEPASFQGEIPEDIVFYDEDAASTHAEMHNVYGHYMAEATYEGLKKYDKRRPFVITRACYAGTQKFSTAWTGDNHSIWAHLQMAIPQMCNLGLSGMGFVGTDVGGFGSDTTPELLARWIQVGCFSPLLRNHSCKGTIFQEPWQFDEETLDIYRTYVELRYQLLPYIYDGFVEMSKSGMPIFRPLVLAYQGDKETFEINDEFLVGECMLISPVVMQGMRRKMVYLPKGEWFDYHTKEKITGPVSFIREAPLTICPVYVKAGSILPNYPIQQYVGEQEIETLILDIYPGKGSYLHYQDDGESFAYEQGRYNLYEFTIAENGKFTARLQQNGYEKVYKAFQLKYEGRERTISFEHDYLEVEF